MKTAEANVGKPDATFNKPVCCAQCGWPGTGNLPVGVRVINRNGTQVLVGRLSYFHISTVLCSVCQEMKSAVTSRLWFVEAHAEYLGQLELKKRLLAGQ